MISVKNFLKDYCKTSTLHGLRYIVHEESKPWERRMWSVFIIAASITILMHLYASWEKYSNSSVQIIVDNPRYSLNNINFPAITMCSANKIMYSKAKQLILDNYKHDVELYSKYENALYVLGMLQYPTYRNLANFIEKNPVTNLPPTNLTDLMLKLMPSIDEMFHSCYWRGTGFNCTDLIRLQRTDEGFCYSFNSKTAERRTNDSKVPPMTGANGFLIPLKNNAVGKMTGFEVIMKNLMSEYFPFDNQTKGFNIMVHTPEDFPDISNNYKIVNALNQSARISVGVSYIKSDRAFAQIAEEERKCFLYRTKKIYDTKLPSYWSNAEDNCFSRCRLQITSKMCNCTPYYFNLEEADEHCGIEHIQCLSRIDVLQRNVHIVSKDNKSEFPKWSWPMSMNCSCPNPCSFVGYTTEFRHYKKDFVEFTDFPDQYIHIDLHYKERFAIRYQRVMKHSTQDVIVTFGGMASLFLGCSLVSLLEIIFIVYKWLAMLKQNYSKVHPISNRRHLVMIRRYNTNKFRKPLYKAPVRKKQPAEVCFTVTR